MAMLQSLLATAASQGLATLDAQLLLSHCIGKPRTYLYAWPEVEIDPITTTRFEALCARRLRGEPVAYLLGEREFWSLALAVSPDTLIPRPETELLVEWALSLPLPAAANVVDLGTGSGAIALALASERPGWKVVGVDRSAAALAIACANARKLGIDNIVWCVGDWLTALSGTFDLIVANPPYIAADDPHLQRGDVRFEPASALVAEDAGLADLRHIAGAAAGQLAPGGWCLLEHGYQQAAAVRALLRQAGFEGSGSRCDLAGIERVSGGRMGSQP